MPIIRKIRIENFKGIEVAEIEIENRSACPVITLIGLNESGKTTILEALAHFTTGDRSVASLFEGPRAPANSLGLIPLHRRAAFTGKVAVCAYITLTERDINDLQKIAGDHGYVLDRDSLKSEITVSRTLEFKDSAFKKSTNYWNIEIYVKSPRAKTFKEYERPEDGENDLWLACIGKIQANLMQIAYFPTFLVDMPQRIYLKEHDNESALNRHYRFVLQDILDSLGDNLSLEKHVCSRIDAYKKEQQSPSWFSAFLGSASKSPVDSVFQKISNAVTKEVLGSWQRVFQRTISARSISIDWSIDAEKEDLPYATFHVSDGESKYAIDERSLGFRWFFSFLLFTAFKKGKERKTIFIFDEPAANLHAKAQAELLTSFSRLASGGNKIIYSTHSHHMINPGWLSAAYIVENKALDYDSEDAFGLDTKPTKITAIPYRKFVADFSTRTSYFQPVIEKLEYVPPEVVGIAPYLVVEGITDYYALMLARKISGLNYSFSILPGAGSGASGPIISLLIAQGQRFSILLDDDAEGKKAALKYKEDWYLKDDNVYTLQAVDPEFSGKAIEKILGPQTLELVKAHLNLAGKPSKKQLGWYLSEAYASTDDVSLKLPGSALKSLHRILSYCEGKLGGTEQ